LDTDNHCHYLFLWVVSLADDSPRCTTERSVVADELSCA
jgi:hypothetical protein